MALLAALAVAVVLAARALLGTVDWSAVADALGDLRPGEITVLVLGLLLRQSLSAMPLTFFVPGLSLPRAVANDQATGARGGAMVDTREQAVKGMSLPTLTAMVVGSMVGAGVFSLPARFGSATGVVGAVVAWVIAGAGILMLAFVFQNLAVRRPHLDAGIFAYAKAGFGDYVGFNSAFGYWASACAGNAFYWVFIMTTVGALFPAPARATPSWRSRCRRSRCGRSARSCCAACARPRRSTAS